MDLHFVTTGDGSRTLYHPMVGEHYHSKHGAWRESQHVFVNSGLDFFVQNNDTQQASVLEVGFGTGLNFLLSAQYAQDRSITLEYLGIEAYPLPRALVSQTAYETYVETSLWNSFIEHYEKALLQKTPILSCVDLAIVHSTVLDFTTKERFDVVYFDAFAAIHQPEMWTEEVLSHISTFLRPGGVFVTYAITGNLKRSMKALGFAIEKAPGAPGKREMLRAIKK